MSTWRVHYSSFLQSNAATSTSRTEIVASSRIGGREGKLVCDAEADVEPVTISTDGTISCRSSTRIPSPLSAMKEAPRDPLSSRCEAALIDSPERRETAGARDSNLTSEAEAGVDSADGL